MSYPIGYVVFGVSLHDAPKKFAKDVNLISEGDLANKRYSGSGLSPLFVGVEKYCASNPALHDLMLVKLTEEDLFSYKQQVQVILDFESEYENISNEFKQWLKEVPPYLFIAWGSS